MQLIEAIVRPASLEAITTRLTALGVTGCTALECKGFGRQRGHTERYRGGRMDVGFVPKVILQLAVKDADVASTLQAITGGARSGRVGDGKVFVSPLGQAVRIRTGEVNDGAL